MNDKPYGETTAEQALAMGQKAQDHYRNLLKRARFVRVWTTGQRIDELSDSMALQLLHEQYGDIAGTRAFVNLITQVEPAPDNRRSTSFTIEYRGIPCGLNRNETRLKALGTRLSLKSPRRSSNRAKKP